MTLNHPFLAGPPDDRSRPWRVITDGSRTSGIGFGDARISPGAPGPGRHVHTHEDEAIYVISGVLTVEVGDQRYEAGPESLVWLPRGVPHIFANLGEEEVRHRRSVQLRGAGRDVRRAGCVLLRSHRPSRPSGPPRHQSASRRTPG